MNRALLLAVVAAFFVSGCAAIASLGSDAGPRTDAGAAFDGASTGGPDEGTSPMGTEGFDPSRAATPSDLSPGDLANLYTCYDGIDNSAPGSTGSGEVDCADPGCAGLASCCPGPGFACCDAPSDLTLPSFCEGNLAACAMGFTLFGTPTPYAHGGAIYPNGDHHEDSGLVLDQLLDPWLASYVTAHVTLPDPSSCATGTTCIESVAVGFVPDVSFGAATTVRPVAALVASATLGTVSLVSGDVVLASAPVPTTHAGTEASFDVVLGLSAAGRVDATIGTMHVSGRIAPPGAPMRLAVWGHDENHDASTAASSANAVIGRVAQATCDVPSVWESRDQVSIGAGGQTPPGDLTGPSVAYGAADAYLAFASAGAIYVAHRATGDMAPASLFLQAGYDHPTIATTGVTYADPDIHHLSAGGWRIYALNTGTSAVLAFDADETTPFTYDAAMARGVLGVGDDVLTNIGVTSIDGPSVLPPGSRADWVMALRLHFASGPARIVLFASPDGLTGWTLLHGTLDASTVTIPSGVSDVAHDEAASPSLIARNGGYQLFYAGRTFGRWAVGVVLSDTLDFWRPAPSPVVLGGAGGTAFDAYSVRDPGVSSVDGNPGRIEMFYAASDGAKGTLGRVERPAATSWPTVSTLVP